MRTHSDSLPLGEGGLEIWEFQRCGPVGLVGRALDLEDLEDLIDL